MTRTGAGSRRPKTSIWPITTMRIATILSVIVCRPIERSCSADPCKADPAVNGLSRCRAAGITPDGKFGGVAAVTVNTAYFEDFYRQFDVGPRGTITLMTDDGVVLAHGAATGRDAKQRPWLNDIPYHPRFGVLHPSLPGDASERIGYYQRDQRYPLLVVATLTQADLLAPWEKASRVRIAVVICLVLLIVVIGVFLVRQLQRGRRMADALASQEQNFRLLAESSSDIVARIGLDGRVPLRIPVDTPRARLDARAGGRSVDIDRRQPAGSATDRTQHSCGATRRDRGGARDLSGAAGGQSGNLGGIDAARRASREW